MENSILYIDLGDERVIGAERDGQKIAIEVKSFLRQSPVTEFHGAIGQFIGYRDVLNIVEPDRILYLAVPLITYRDFLQVQDFPQLVMHNNQIKLIVYDQLKEIIVQWQN